MLEHVASLLVILVVGTLSQTGPGIPCFCLQELDQPQAIRTSTSIASARDGSGRLFVTEQSGLIWVWGSNGTRYEEPFLDMTQAVVTIESCGLHAIVFHPNYGTNGLAYVYATGNSSSGDFYTRVIEYKVSESNPNQLDPSTERRVFGIQCGDKSGDCHYGGMFLFGGDGYLYIGHGDGVCCSDTNNDGQNRSTYLGAIHRIDVDSRTGGLEYGVPSDNPFLSDPTARPEMYAYGMRQPYKGSMDMGDKNTGQGYGRIFIGDVGASEWEEINILQPGGNYGWSAYEGPDCFKPEYCDTIGPHIAPITAYNHSMGICVISGSVYRGTQIPDLLGWFLFSDYGSSKFFSAREVTSNQWEWKETPLCDTCPDEMTNQYPRYITCMGADEEGEQYFASANATWVSNVGTRLFRLMDPRMYY